MYQEAHEDLLRLKSKLQKLLDREKAEEEELENKAKLIKELKTKIKVLENEREESLSTNLKVLNKKNEKELESVQKLAKEEKDNLKQDIYKKEGIIDSLKNEISKLNNKLESIGDEFKNMENNSTIIIENHKKEIEKLKSNFIKSNSDKEEELKIEYKNELEKITSHYENTLKSLEEDFSEEKLNFDTKLKFLKESFQKKNEEELKEREKKIQNLLSQIQLLEKSVKDYGLKKSKQLGKNDTISQVHAKRIKFLEEELKETNEELENLKNKLRKKTEASNDFKHKLNCCEQELAGLREEKLDLERELKEKSQFLHKIKEELRNTKSLLIETEVELKKQSGDKDLIKKVSNSSKQEIDILKAQLRESVSEQNKYLSMIKQFKITEENLKYEKKISKEKIEKLEIEFTKLKEKSKKSSHIEHEKSSGIKMRLDNLDSEYQLCLKELSNVLEERAKQKDQIIFLKGSIQRLKNKIKNTLKEFQKDTHLKEEIIQIKIYYNSQIESIKKGLINSFTTQLVTYLRKQNQKIKSIAIQKRMLEEKSKKLLEDSKIEFETEVKLKKVALLKVEKLKDACKEIAISTKNKLEENHQLELKQKTEQLDNLKIQFEKYRAQTEVKLRQTTDTIKELEKGWQEETELTLNQHQSEISFYQNREKEIKQIFKTKLANLNISIKKKINKKLQEYELINKE